MFALHNSRLKEFRDPFGAAKVGSTVRLSINIWDADVSKVTIRTWIDGVGETHIPCIKQIGRDNSLLFSGSLSLEATGIVWYVFIIETADGAINYYIPLDGKVGGEGRLSPSLDASFQITVYKGRKEYPTWYEKGIVYQIFPDRFNRGEDWRERSKIALAYESKSGIARELVEDWDTPPTYKKKDDGSIAEWDFYGGTLKGIEEKLDYLSNLGVTALYLNPIFAAQSNHRYDTANYMKIDDMLGDDSSFRHLCQEAAKYGISIILDGVFNHTGDDSLYFNKYGTFPEKGAWQGEDSKYHDWYQLNDDGSYACWWGVKDLPAMNKSNKDWQRFVYGPKSVVEHWLNEGAKGWRLDVADELNDSFIAGIKSEELAVKSDALLLGEVWEDASHKIAYSELRHYLCGDELDSAMDYPFRDGIINYLTESSNAEDFVELMMSLKENYPRHAFYGALNLLGSHDRPRIITLLGGAPDKDSLSEEERANFKLSEGARGLAKGRFWLASLIQMCSPGVPSIYYGDEAGLEGYADPYNRATYPWGSEDADFMTMCFNAISLRRSFPLFTDGEYEPFSIGSNVYGFWRYSSDSSSVADGEKSTFACFEEEALCVIVNRSLSDVVHVTIPGRAENVCDLIGGREISQEGDNIAFDLPQLGSVVLYVSAGKKLNAPLSEGHGVLAHITSLPNSKGPGTLGSESYEFVNWLHSTNQKYWQVLPVAPVDGFNSPYAGRSAFAGNTQLICELDKPLEDLYKDWKSGRIGAKDLVCDSAKDFVSTDLNFDAFVALNKDWLEPYACYIALHKLGDEEKPWQEWDRKYHEYSPKLLKNSIVADEVLYQEFLQWVFELQWQALKLYANSFDIKIIGDMPMYVNEDSADVWANQAMFNLDEEGYPAFVSGCPPDNLAKDGQVWGNPTYKWDLIADRDYSWWISRLKRMFTLYDYVRMDHFIGFENFYSIPAGSPGKEGTWMRGPSYKFFNRLYKEFGPLPIIAEDLGTVTPQVRALVARCGFNGLDIVEFADNDIRSGFFPKRDKIVYTSTHDTDTLLGWVKSRFEVEDDSLARAVFDKIVIEVFACDAKVKIMPLQDILMLDSDARMNVPGRATDNWTWQAK